jgi:succinyl-diaminopimelate desuccinylase
MNTINTQIKDIFDAIEKDKEQAVSLVSELVSIPTVNPPGLNYLKMVCYLEKKLKSIGLIPKRIVAPLEMGENRILCLAGWNVGAKKTFHINFHYDVVPAGENWRTDPFTAVIKNNKIFGRGTVDTKGNIAALFTAVSYIKKKGLSPASNLELSFTPDEETGGRAGFGYLVKNNLINPNFALGEGHSGNYICNGNKGGIRLEVEVLGKSCHASTPYLGKNAFDSMLVVASELKKIQDKISKKFTKVSTKDKREKFATMVMGGKLQGGDTANVVPNRVIFSIDRRVLPEEDIKFAQRQILDVIKRAQSTGIRINIKTQMFENPVYVDKNENICRISAQAVKAVTGRDARFAIMGGLTDLRYLQEKGISCVGYGATGGNSAHCANEFVYVDSVIKTAKVFAYIILNLT